MRVLGDDDVRALLPPPAAMDAMRRAFALQAAGALDAPPRTSVASAGGRLVLTIGASSAHGGPAGFRAYHDGPGANEQLVVVFDGDSGALKGAVVGRALGNLRTAAINAVALDALARPDARVLGVLGSGSQAAGHARLALAARSFTRVLVYSPTAERRRAFAAALAAESAVEVTAAGGAEEVVRAADVLIVATSSRAPVLEPGWLRPGTHVNSVGPKGHGASELPPAVGARAGRIATDSLAQAGAYPEPFFLDPADAARMVGLERVLGGELPGRSGEDEVTLFCSVGLAGTEVMLADTLLERYSEREAAAAGARGGAPGGGPRGARGGEPEGAGAHADAGPGGTSGGGTSGGGTSGGGAAVRLEPLAPDALDAYLAGLVPDYAAEHVRAGNWSAEDAEERARQQMRELLPQGAVTPGHALLDIVDAASGERVGRAWTMIHRAPAGRELFVLDLEVFEERRRRGYAFSAMREVEAMARAAGAERLSLHVFGGNVGARALYRRLGLQEVDVTMAKRL